MSDTNSVTREISRDMVEIPVINMSDVNMADVDMAETNSDANSVTCGGVSQHDPQPALQQNSKQNSQQNSKQKKKSGDVPEIPENPELRRAHVDENHRYLALHLPPMDTLEEIFRDIAAKAMSLGFDKVLKRLGERPLRVATVCSGTESPILAMEMLQQGKSPSFLFSNSPSYTYPGFDSGPQWGGAEPSKSKADREPWFLRS